MNAEEVGKEGYQLCIEKSWDPKLYVDGIMGIGPLGEAAERITKQLIAENFPEELPDYDICTRALVGAFAEAAKEAGDKETAEYVASLLEQSE